MTEDASAAARLRRMIVGYRLSQAIHVAARLGVADQLADGPRRIEDLAEATGTHAASLGRVLRLLASEGVFEELEPGRFALTALAEPLRSDAQQSLRARAVFDGEACNWQAWSNLLQSVVTGSSAFEHTHGSPTFAYFERHPQIAARFDALMAEQTEPVAREVAAVYDFAPFESVADLGGGYGALLAAILSAHPHLTGTLVDLPHVVAGARSRLQQMELADRCQTVAGDFFQSVPAGRDVYILKYILHDWDDDQCRTILRNCRQAVSSQGRLLVLEALMRPGNEPDYTKYLDVNMLVVTEGRERTREEYADLFRSTGFELTRIVPTGSEISIIEGRPA